MKTQQFIDVELLRQYPTATDEQKELLEHVYGKETFTLYREIDHWLILQSLLEQNKSIINIPGARKTYPILHNGKVYKVIMSIEIDNEVDPSTVKFGAWTDIIDLVKNFKRRHFS